MNPLRTATTGHAADGLPRPEFLPRMPRGRGLAAAWALTGLACLAVAGADAYSAWQARQAVEAQRDAAQARLDRLPAPPAARRADAQAAALADSRAAATPAATDWRETFAAVEAASLPGIDWLRLDQAPGGGLRLSGRAANTATALAAAERLRGRAGWRDVLLAQMEAVPAAPGTGPATPDAVHFELTAQRAAMP